MPRSASARAAVLLALAVGAWRAQPQPLPDAGPGRDGGAAEMPDAGPAPFRAFAGTVILVDWPAQKLTVETAGRPVAMTFDRNTQVYLPERLGTLRDLAPGVQVRVAESPAGLAFWIEVARGAAAPDGGAARVPSPPGGGEDGGASAPLPPAASRP